METRPTQARAAARKSLIGLTSGLTTGLTSAVLCCLLLACASKGPPPPPPNRCPPDNPACVVEVVFTDVGLGERVARLDGRLSAAQPNALFAFNATARETLRLTLSGPAISLVLVEPDGTPEGPGLPPEMVLPAKGKYVLRVEADTKVANAFGNFQLEMRLTRAP